VQGLGARTATRAETAQSSTKDNPDAEARQQLIALVSSIRAQLSSFADLFEFIPADQLSLQFATIWVPPFRSPHVHSGEASPLLDCLTLRELEMHAFMLAIRDKPNWAIKIEQFHIRQKWRQEFLEQSTLQSPLSVDACISELRYWAKQCTRANPTASDAFCLPSPPSQTTLLPGVKHTRLSDDLIDLSLSREFEQCVARLESVTPPDFHPGSHDQVVNLIHPSLYCLRLGPQGSFVMQQPCHDRNASLAHSLNGDGDPQPLGAAHDDAREDQVSKRFAWMPTDVRVSDDGQSCRFDSYINNLHPTRAESAALYPILEHILARFLPLFQRTLTELRNPTPPCCRTVRIAPADRDLAWATYRAEEDKLSGGASSSASSSRSLPHTATSSASTSEPNLVLPFIQYVAYVTLEDGVHVNCDTVITVPRTCTPRSREGGVTEMLLQQQQG
jgi:hypothetical protein